MEARLLTRRDGARLALVSTWAFAVFLGAVGVDDLAHLGLVPLRPDAFGFACVALAIVGAALSPWLATRSGGARVRVACEAGRVAAGALSIEASSVTGLSIAAGERGFSVAVARGPRVAFFEVERRSDATRIARALGASGTWFGTVPLPEASRLFAAIQGVTGVVLVAAAALYFAGAMGWADSSKELWGATGVAGALVATALLTARRLLPHQALAVRRAAWDRHVALHEAAGRFARSGPADDEADRDHEAAERAPRALARGDEPLAAWLARVDALPADGGAYRAAMKRDDLWQTLGDAAAPADARIAAARLLRRRHGEDEGLLVRVVEDADVRVRVEAAIDEDDDAVERLERLGPLFRAR